MHIVNVALPTLSSDFDAPLSDVQWTVIAYLLALAVVIPASGWIGDRIGTKRHLRLRPRSLHPRLGACGAAQSLPQLVAARVLQGVGGGLMTPTGTAMLYRAYGPEKRARVARTLLLPILIGPGLAPIIGGVLTETLSWRWVFPDQRAVRHRDGRLRLALPPRAPRRARGSPRPEWADPLGRRLELASLCDQRGLGHRLGFAGDHRRRGRRGRPALAVRPPVPTGEGSDPACCGCCASRCCARPTSSSRSPPASSSAAST